MDAAAMMPIERRKRTVFGVLKCHGVGLAEWGLARNDDSTKFLYVHAIYVHTDRKARHIPGGER